MNTSTAPQALTIFELEQVYDVLAQAIDRVGPESSEKFLVKLALLNANALANPALIQSHMDAALKDL